MGKGVAKVVAESDNQIHEIIILCRSKETRGKPRSMNQKKALKNNKISMILCDLAKLSDVKKTIKDLHSQHGYLDGLFINAGLGYAAERVETEDGMDSHFQGQLFISFYVDFEFIRPTGKI